MASKKSIYMRKQTINGTVCAVPIYKTDIEILEKIKGDFESVVSQYRNLGHHRKLFAIINKCCDNGILDKIESIDPLTVEMMKRQHGGNEVDTVLYILKWLFLPLENVLLPDGTRYHIVSSISFKEMDQISFEIFYLASVKWLAETLDISINDLEGNFNQEV